EAEEILIKNTGSFAPEVRQEVETSKPEKAQEKPAKPAADPTEKEPPHTGTKIVGKIDLSSLKRGGKAQPKVVEQDTKPAEETAPKAEALEPPATEKPAEQQAAKETPDESKDTPATAAPETTLPAKAEEKAEPAKPADEVIRARAQRLTGPNVVGRIDLPKFQPREKPVESSSAAGGMAHDQKSKRKRKDKHTQRP